MAYDKNSILNKTPLIHIRDFPSGYITEGTNGIFHIFKEIADNSVDEIQLKGSNGAMDIIIFVEKDRSNIQFCVIDNGRGIPKESLVQVFANTLTSGKYDKNNNSEAYRFTTGLYGVGSSVSLALSKYFRAIAFNGKVMADATIRYDDIPEQPTYYPNTEKRIGTVVTFEPDDTIFNDIPSFIDDHSVIYTYLYNLSLFSHYQLRLFTVYNGIPKNIRKADPETFLAYLDKIRTTEVPSYDKSVFNREQYVTNFFGITKNWDKRFPISGINSEDTLRLNGELLISLSNNFSGNTKLTMVNDIMFSDNVSTHIVNMYNYLKSRLAHHIQDKRIKSFFTTQYKLPVWLFLDVKYARATFSGLAKTGFHDPSFQPKYISLLNKIISNELIDELYRLIEKHMLVQYEKFSNSDFRPTNIAKGLLQKLNRPKKFNDCSTTNRSIAELFLVEGDSAKSDQDRNSSFQASYTLGGKPFNGLTVPSKLDDAMHNIKKNETFQDIIRIINIIPGSNDLSNLNFNKIFIMADADTHGYHITNIVIGNLYVLCPALVNNGHVYVVIPPLYSLSTKNEQPIYFKNAQELNVTLAYHVYYEYLRIELESSLGMKELSQEEFVVFCDLVMKIGDEINRASVEYAIPAIVIEQLALMTNYLNINIPDVEAMQKLLGCEIRYIPSGHILVISIGSEDIFIPLHNICDMIYKRILPLYREFYYGKNRIFVTTKKTDTFKRSPTSIVQLCEIFEVLNKPFTIKRYKGLGSTPSGDKAVICTNPETRRVFQISHIGDVQRVFDMLGSDPQPRKLLMDGENC